MLAQTEGKTQTKGLEEGQKCTQSPINKHFVRTDWWGQVIQLISYKAKNGNLESLCLALS